MIAQFSLGVVENFDQGQGKGFFRTEGSQLLFYATDRRVLSLNRQTGEWEWLRAPTPVPVSGDRVVFSEGVGNDGSKKAVVWGYEYDGLRFLLNADAPGSFKTPHECQLFITRAGTLVYAREGCRKIFERRVDTADFEATPEEYIKGVVNFDPGEHPRQWEKLRVEVSSLLSLSSPLNEGKYEMVSVWPRIVKEDDYASNTQSGQCKIGVYTPGKHGGLCFEKVTMYFHRDGSVFIDSGQWEGNKYVQYDTPLFRTLLEKVGIEVVTEKRAITAREAISANFDGFTARHKPTPEREAEILLELRERFGWVVYPPAIPPAATIVVPVSYVYSQITRKTSKELSEATKLALIGIYDPTAVAEWEDVLKDGFTARLNGFRRGPGTSVWSADSKHKLPGKYKNGFFRITEYGGFNNQRWELLAYGKDEAGMAAFREMFEALDQASGTGAIIMIGLEGAVANMIG